jgi:hypothetical protein
MEQRAGALETRTVKPLFITAVLGIAVILAILILQYGNMHAYRRFDIGVTVNVAWKMHLGYVPYRDFLTTLPPLFLLGCKYFFDLLGLYWSSAVIFTAIFVVITYLLHVAILYKMRIGEGWAVFLPFMVQCMTLVPVPHWWFNQITSVVGCLFISAAMLLYKRPKDNFTQLAFLSITTLLFLAKPNLGMPLLLFTLLIFMAIPSLRLLAIKLTGSAVVLAILVLLLAKINPWDVILSYRSASRPISALLFKHIFHLLPFINHSREQVFMIFIFFVPCLLALGIILDSVFRTKSETKIEMPYFALALAGMISGFISMLTNHDLFINGLVIILLSFVILMLLLKPYLPKRRDRMFVFYSLVLSVALFTANGLIMMRSRLQLDHPLVRLDSPPFFKGMYVTPRFTRILGQIDDVLKKGGYIGQANAGIFFGPGLEFGYELYGINPRKGLPVWWESNLKTKEIVQRFKDAHFEIAIFLIGQYTFFPKEVKEYLDNKYAVYDYGELTVHQLLQ